MEVLDNDKLIRQKQDIIDILKKDADYAVEKFDTLIVSLSSGGLVFSVGFVKDIVKNFHKVDLFWLKFCWICFALSLIGSLVSQVTGYYSNKHEMRAVKAQIKRLNNITEIEGIDIDEFIRNLQVLSDRFDKCTIVLNGVCLISFSIAVGSLIVFIYSNV